MPAVAFTPTFLFLMGGLIIWAARFLAAYSFTAVACAKGWTGADVGGFGLVPLVIAALSLVSIAGCAALLLRAISGSRRVDRDDGEHADRFIDTVAALVAGLAGLAILWETLPVFLVPVCL